MVEGLKGRRARLLCATAMLVLFSSSAVVSARAAETRQMQFDIPAGDLSSSLKQFGQVADQQIIFSEEVVRGLRAPAVKGNLTTDEALQRLLQPSGLSTQRTKAGVLLVQTQKSRASSETDNPKRAGAGLSPTTQTAQATGAVASEQRAEEIVVTAQKRAERVRDVPQAVSVLTGDQLDRVGAKELGDLAAYIPGLSLRGGSVGTRTIVLRGITTNATSDLGSRIVGIYVDDVAFGTGTPGSGVANFDLDLSMFDLDRVEVLNGPQGTLYGASSLGGLLKYVTKAPDLTRYTARAETSFGFLSGGESDRGFRAVVNAPIVEDRAAVRVQAYHQHFGGFVDNISPARHEQDIDGVDAYGGRVQLLLKPSDQLSLKLVAMGQDMRRDGSSGIQWNLATNAPLYGDLNQSIAGREPFTQRYRVYSGTADYDLGFATLTGVVAHQDSVASQEPDATDRFALLFRQALGVDLARYVVSFHPKIAKNSAELRLASTGGERFEWLIGGYYDNEKIFQTQQISGFDAAGARSPINFITAGLRTYYRELAAFANGTFHITENWDLSGGIRGTRADSNYEQTGSGLLGLSLPARGDRDYIPNYAASTKYKLGEWGMVYARFSTGYRPGGPNGVANDPATGAPLASPVFAADKTKNYEVGAKVTLIDWLALDVASYRIDWSSIQLNAARNGFGVRANGGDAKSQGVELALQARPTRGLTLAASATYTDAKLVDPAPDLQAHAGDRLPGASKWAFALTGDYEFPLVSGWNGSVGGTLSHVGRRNSGFDGSSVAPNFVQPAYDQLDLRASVASDRYQLQLFVHNLTDERGIASGTTTVNAGVPSTFVTFIRPRTVGLTLDIQF
ncbi:MAG: Outer rane receptor protein mostly Fe transport [Rhodospirillales bacterium]|nr:Outer rane receptor protein mostly Fe transport [Rhodospirillales bacterium]